MVGGNVRKAGRVVMDDDAIAQRPVWGLFGDRFRLPWSDIVSWNVKDAIRLERATGEERVVGRVLSLYRKGGVDFIHRSARDTRFQLIVDELRRRLPDKENFPIGVDYLDVISRMRSP